MNISEVQRVVEEIYAFLQKQLWMDFEVMQYQHHELLVTGSIDISRPHDIEIRFGDVFFMSLPIEWRTDTSKPVLTILEGDEARRLNMRFQVEQGHHIFRFAAEHFPEDFGCLIAAKNITFLVPKQHLAI